MLGKKVKKLINIYGRPKINYKLFTTTVSVVVVLVFKSKLLTRSCKRTREKFILLVSFIFIFQFDFILILIWPRKKILKQMKNPFNQQKLLLNNFLDIFIETMTELCINK